MCHLVLGPVWSGTLPDLSIKSRLPLRATSGESLRGPLVCILPVMRTDQREICRHLLGELRLALPLNRLMKPPGPENYQLQIKDCPFGPQPTDHSVPPRPITNNYKLPNSMVSDRCKARKISKGIIVKPDKVLLGFTLMTAVASHFTFFFLCRCLTTMKLDFNCNT